MKIAEGSTVTIDYTMTLEDGEILDSTKDLEPLTYIQGTGEIITGLEKAVVGMEKGDKLDVAVAAADAFGEFDPEALIEVPKKDLPSEAQDGGVELTVKGPKGQTITGRVVEVKGNTAIVDFNRPLAGKNLNVSVTIVDVKLP